MRVEKLTAANLGAVSTLLKGMDQTFRPFGVSPSPADISMGLAQGDEAYAVFSGGSAVAFGMLRWHCTDTPAIGLCVAPSARRRGLGLAVLLLLHCRARDRGASKVMLHVDDANHGAKSLYQSVGYRQLEDRWVCDV